MTIAVPSLSTRGWATDISDKADLLLSYYFSTDYLQSVAWIGQVSSFHEKLEKHQHQPEQLRQAVEFQLGDYLGRYFEGAEANVAITVPDKDRPNELTLEFRVKVQQGGKVYSLGRVVETIDSTIKLIFDINNG